MTTKTSEKKVPRRNEGQGNQSGENFGGRDPRFPYRKGSDGMHKVSPEQYRIGMLVAIAAILMMFVGLVSAYLVRAASPLNDWESLSLPRILWVSTILLFISSVTFEISRRKFLVGRYQDYSRWLFVTAWLGFAFILAQLWAWRELSSQGIYLSKNPHAAFYYVLTALHAVHLLGGVIALGYLIVRSVKEKMFDAELRSRRIGSVEASRLYWHFLDILWVALFALLFFW